MAKDISTKKEEKERKKIASKLIGKIRLRNFGKVNCKFIYYVRNGEIYLFNLSFGGRARIRGCNWRALEKNCFKLSVGESGERSGKDRARI